MELFQEGFNIFMLNFIAIGASDIGKLRELLTESMYTTTIKEVGLKEKSIDKSHIFDWSAKLELPKIVCVRYPFIKNMKLFKYLLAISLILYTYTQISVEKLESFAQITIYFHGTQTLNVGDISGKLISSSTSPVNEYWTFERHLQKYNSVWKLCAKPTQELINNI